MSDSTEVFWGEILSRQAERVQTAYSTLSEDEKFAILKHLKRMTTEPGWHPDQVESASTALEILKDKE